MKIRTLFAATATLAALAAWPVASQSTADFPTKAMTYIIPFDAGGESDISARFQQSVWKKYTGQDVIIQYQPGAGGAQAWSQLNDIAGDGYTIMGINLPHTILQPMEGNVGYTTDDLTPVNYFHYTPNAILVPADSEFKTLQDLIDYAKSNPGMVTFAGSGSKSANNLAQAQFDAAAGTTTTYVPFSGTGPSITAVLGKQTTAGFNYATSAIAQGDALRILAVAAEERMPAFPDVPTFKELGLDLVGGAYRGVAVPASTPEDLRQRISDIVSEINADPDFVKKMEDGGFVLTDFTYDKMPEFIARMKEEYATSAKALGIGQ
ncbi:MAG: tripartite tricarboxylate transporter substrate binding protein [Paracoccus sp. (in: a-proteobacteria)]|jgi:tripartite-type tricarboxylate transporter receptor subunit TctC|uniref:tripartite tricarboxylate transporter substrate binding protein n=1 Tax=unclassified Paracoccus (in: a-proteobacteria) TaxID=2688777 RepID=UPI000C568595|nr:MULTISPECIES: tripartite tricarboxylate transporter substrate binding protein [unclassified Paracoccus (in: a-proteobacteria)]MAN56777.1 C4-dicarboxylate ABC transporter substrate-binding protein [Paracoccus sp. (in: a-proteobacteria)]MBA48196.1 C4-dicarboxylate ABC transporter substrate-binding protein [Paracoccus sp. (in: a-proteobacteria)]MDB2552008.1 tripartite tricarboxylate transporter substrate binding protein [Paracoccus sp. (in: a-proteobacteria)]HIC65524.1 tripartite tricarboxylate|tara:strand:- start:3375 stop:4337 length:963 start_codon:yes stop_codon:yes gene_type:complete